MTEDVKRKRREKNKVNTKSGLFNPELDAQRFNSSFEGITEPIGAPTDCGQVNMSLGGDCGSGSAGSACESLELNEKRETKRYYVRPQDIFCANKDDVLKALISVYNAGENCTVYSLKNLGDHEDIHKLTNQDIIYYYDEGVLLDKNKIPVLDYDLFIKHEEERKKINKDPVAFTKQDYDQNYDDRMTKETVVENLFDFDFAGPGKFID